MTRRARPLLLSALLLTSLASLGPGAAANFLTCSANLDAIQASPMYADPGQTVKVRVTLRDGNPLPDGGPGTTKVRIKVSASYADGTEALPPTWVGPLDIGQVFERNIPIPVDVPESASGRATIRVELPADGPPPLNGLDFVDWCALGDIREMTWGFYLREKPDLRVEDGSVRLLRHFETDGAPFHTYHAETMRPNERFVRYPTVLGGNGLNTCLEETGDSFPGANNGFVSRGHFEFAVGNAGRVNFRANASSGGELPLTFRIVDRTQFPAAVVGTETRVVAINAGSQLTITLTGLNYSLVNRAGLRNLAIEVDADRAYAETDEANNVFATPNDRTEPGAVYFQAPDLVPGLKNVRLTADGRVAGTFFMENIGDRTAGDPAEGEANNICHSRTGSHPSVRVYLDLVDPAYELDHLNATLGPAGSENPLNRTGDEDFESAFPLAPGPHAVIVVADARVNETIPDAISELNETNNVIRALFHVGPLPPDHEPPVVALTSPVPGRLHLGGWPVAEASETIVVGDLLVAADATDAGSGVSHVAFRVDGETRWVDHAAPYEWTWAAGDEVLGEHVLTAVAYDRAGRHAGVSERVITVPASPEGLAATAEDCTAALAPWACRILDEFTPDVGEVCREVLAERWCSAL